MEQCIFCQIVTKKIPAKIVYENEHTLAFLDIKPVNPGHTLVIPKMHAETLFTIDQESWAHVAETARHIAPAILHVTSAVGMNIHMNNHRVAGQLVDHVHLHLIPRHENDGHEHWHGIAYEPGVEENIAQRLRDALA